MVTTEEILKKYSRKIESQIGTESASKAYSRDYEQFKQDMLPDISRYKRWTDSLGSIIKIRLSPKENSKIQRYLNIAHLDVTPSQAASLALVSMFIILFANLVLVLSISLLGSSFPIMLTFLGFILSGFVYYYVYSMPNRLANIWRLKASAQMI